MFISSCYFIYNARRDTAAEKQFDIVKAEIDYHVFVIFWLTFFKFLSFFYSFLNTDDTGTRSSSEMQEKRNRRKKVTFNKDIQMLQSK